MKAKISNIEVTGTPAEIAELIKLVSVTTMTLQYGIYNPLPNPNFKASLSPDFAHGLTNNQE